MKKIPPYIKILLGDKMSDFDIKNKVVQSNDLIQLTQWSLNIIPLKIFKTFVSCIDIKKALNNNSVEISKKELFDLVGSNSSGGYDYLKRQLRELQKTSVKIYEDSKKEVYISLINKIVWNKETDTIICKFDEDLIPYLIDLKQRFLQYDVFNIKNFKTKYGLIVYEYLLSRERQERNSNHSYSINVEDFRRLTDTVTKFPKFKDLNRCVIKKSVEDINNAKVEFLVDVVNNGQRGVSASHIEFCIRKRTSILEDNFDSVTRPDWLDKKI